MMLKKYLYLITFISGMAVMAIELTASRILAPYFGSSQYVWTDIIAVILAALATGYALGGKISEKSPKLETLLGLIVIASVFLLCIPVMTPLFGTTTFLHLFSSLSPEYAILLQCFLASMAVFFVPIAFLGMVSPFIIKLFSLHEQAMGDVSGKVFAIGTVGSFIGTFLPTVVTIPTIGSKRTIVVFALILFVTAAVGFMMKKHIAFMIIPFLIAGGNGQVNALYPGKLIMQQETGYQYIKVVDVKGINYLQFNESTAVQSAYSGVPLAATFGYYDTATYIPELVTKRPFRVLIIGLAGGTIARNIKDLYGDDVEVTGVEIDPQVIEAGKKYLALGRDGIHIVIEDGRTFLRHDESKYDVIIVDAYANQFYIPFHLATKEFFTLVKSKLADGGVVAMNINDTNEHAKIIQAIGRTVKEVFLALNVAHIPGANNFLLIAGDELHPERMQKASIGPEALRETAIIAANLLHEFKPEPGRVLTDDWAPLEQMTDSFIWGYYHDTR